MQNAYWELSLILKMQWCALCAVVKCQIQDVVSVGLTPASTKCCVFDTLSTLVISSLILIHLRKSCEKNSVTVCICSGD